MIAVVVTRLVRSQLLEDRLVLQFVTELHPHPVGLTYSWSLDGTPEEAGWGRTSVEHLVGWLAAKT